MPGLATKLLVADLVFKKIQDLGGPNADLLNDPANLPFAYLGAIGASLGDLMSARPELGTVSPNTPYSQTWLTVLPLFSGTPTPATRGVYQDVKQLQDTLAKLKDIIDSAISGGPIEKDAQKVKLVGMRSELEDLPNAINDLNAIVKNLNQLRKSIAQAIFKPPKEKIKPSTSWQPRDTLHGSRTGRFLQNIRASADASDNSDLENRKLKAYALGANIGYATDLCGNPYVDGVVGAPYRNHPWRHRWICNYIDTWAWGYYAAGGSDKIFFINDIPNLPYTTWPNLCGANLHKRIDLGLDLDATLSAIKNGLPLPSALPQKFVDFWKSAYNAAYGVPDPSGGVDDAGLQSAFTMSWLILWLQTSGEAIPCAPADQYNYPDNCGTRPPWVPEDGLIGAGGPSPQPAPAASQDTHPSVAEVVSGIVLAILGVLDYNAGLVGDGLALIAAGVGLVADGETDPDWDQLHCYVGWVLPYFYNLTNALHDLLKWGGLGFPYTQELMHDAYLRALNPTAPPTPADSALNTVKSQAGSPTYPASLWASFLPPPPPVSNWDQFPSEPVEPPPENAYPTNPTWPYHFIDGLQLDPPVTGAPAVPPRQLNPLFTLSSFSPPLVRDKTQFTARQGIFQETRPINTFFGNATDVSMDLIKARPDELLDWDLDGDPGIGFPTWVLQFSGAPRSSAVPEP